MVDEGTRKSLSGIPLLKTKAGPRDKDLWVNRLKEEYQALIKVRNTAIIFYLGYLQTFAICFHSYLLCCVVLLN